MEIINIKEIANFLIDLKIRFLYEDNLGSPYVSIRTIDKSILDEIIYKFPKNNYYLSVDEGFIIEGFYHNKNKR